MATADIARPTAVPISHLGEPVFPDRFVQLKEQIVSDTKNVVKAWNEILAELEATTERFNATKQDVCCSVSHNLSFS